MRFSPDRFNNLIGHLGVRAEWRRALPCPCVNPNTGGPQKSCPHCRGLGHLWSGAEPVVVAKAGGSSHKAWADFGQRDDGDAVLSIGSDSPAYEIGPYDRLLMTNQSEPFTLALVRGLNDRIRFSVLSIDKVLAIVGGVVTECGLPDVLPSGELEWAQGGPPLSQSYSVSGRRRVEYFCNPEQPLDRPFHAGARLPRKVVMKRFELLGR